MTRSRLALVAVSGLALAAALLPASAEARKKVRRPPCPGGAFVVVGDPLIPGRTPRFQDVPEIGGKRHLLSQRLPSEGPDCP